jgi:hypothetical protein
MEHARGNFAATKCDAVKFLLLRNCGGPGTTTLFYHCHIERLQLVGPDRVAVVMPVRP